MLLVWAIALTCFACSLTAVGTRQLDVRFGPDMRVSTFQNPDWHLRLNPNERIIAIDGRAVDTPQDVADIVTQSPATREFRATALRDGRPVTVPVTASQRTWTGYWNENAALLSFSLIFLLIGTWVACFRQLNREATAFLLLAASLGVFGFAHVDYDLSHRLGAFHYLSQAFVGPAFLYLGLVLRRPDRSHRWVLATGAAFFAAIWGSELAQLHDLYQLIHLELSTAYSGLGMLALPLLALWGFLKTPPLSQRRQQLRIIITAAMISQLPAAWIWIPATLLNETPPRALGVASIVAMAILPLAIAFAAVRYRLFEVEVIIRKTLVYAVTITALIAVYLTTLGLISSQVSAANHQHTIQAILMIAVALLLQPLRQWVQQAIDRVFYRDRADLSVLLERIRHYGETGIEQDQLLAKIAGDLQEALRLQKVAVAVPEGEAWRISHCTPDEPASGLIRGDSLPAAEHFRVPADLAALGWEMGVRLTLNGKTIAILLLGHKLAESPITDADITYANLVLAPLSGFIAYSEARSRQKQTEQEVARLYAQVAQLNNLKDSFSMVTSHELRTPLTVIIGHAEILLDGVFGDLDQQQRESITSIQNHAQTLIRNINDYLDLMHLNQGKLTLQPRSVDVLSALDEVLPEVLCRAQEKAIVVRPLLTNMPAVEADPRRLRQVLLHLLDNAVKFSSHEGEIRIEGQTLGQQAVITIRDNGPGIPADKLDCVFDTFAQVHDPLIRPHGGLGIGLPLAKATMEAMGGRLHLESRLGEGTTVMLRLPIAQRPLPSPPERQAYGGGPDLVP